MAAPSVVYALIITGGLQPGQLWGLFSELRLAKAAESLCISMAPPRVMDAPPEYHPTESRDSTGPVTRMDAFDQVIGDMMGFGPPKGCVVIEWHIDSNRIAIDPPYTFPHDRG